jgi:hypothetical protein
MEKIGRNDPCPCGSGKKFKKCHLGREEELIGKGSTEFSFEMSKKITNLPEVNYGRSGEIAGNIEIEKLTGSTIGIKFVDLQRYQDLELSGERLTSKKEKGSGGVVINILKTRVSDPGNIYVAISQNINDSALVHLIAHVLDYLGGSKLTPGLAKPLSFELGVPLEHLEHPREFGYWLTYLRKRFDTQLDADDTIIEYLYKNEMLVEGKMIEKNEKLNIKSKSERILQFLSEKSAELDEHIRELPGYIGSRVVRD